MTRRPWAALAREQGVGAAFTYLQRLRKGTGMESNAVNIEVPVEIRPALGLDHGLKFVPPSVLSDRLRRILNGYSAAEQATGQLTWVIEGSDAHQLAYQNGVDYGAGFNWSERVALAANSHKWVIDDDRTIRDKSDELVLRVAHALQSPAPTTPSMQDAYQSFADGILAYARLLHAEKRDPALVELRDNTSHTLHEMGFHNERISLGELALEAANYVGDPAKAMEIQIDELGWARYLIGEAGALDNVQDVIDGFERRDSSSGGATDMSIVRVAAKAYRHKAAMLAETSFEESVQAILRAVELASRLVGPEKVAQLAHATFGHAQIIAMNLGVTEAGEIDPGDDVQVALVTTALELLRTAQQDYEDTRDFGRVAKALSLRVRLLAARGDATGVRIYAPLRDRAVRASHWSRDDAESRMFGVPKPALRVSENTGL